MMYLVQGVSLSEIKLLRSVELDLASVLLSEEKLGLITAHTGENRGERESVSWLIGLSVLREFGPIYSVMMDRHVLETKY